MAPQSKTVTLLRSSPGIQRDGTIFNSDCYTDGQWCRFVNGMPRKMGGYSMIDQGTSEIVRSLFISDGFALNINNEGLVPAAIAYIGRSSSLSALIYNPLKKDQYSETDVTPPTIVNPGNYPDDAYKTGFFDPYLNVDYSHLLNSWTFASLTLDANTEDEITYIFAHVAPNANNVANAISGDWVEPEPKKAPNVFPYKYHYISNLTANVFYAIQKENGEIPKPTQFLPFFVSFPLFEGGTKDSRPKDEEPPYLNPDSPNDVPHDPNKNHDPTPEYTQYVPIIALTPSGGILSIYPYLFLYGASGVVAYSSSGNPFEFPQSHIEVIASYKIVAGRSTRGTGTPSVLFWSLNSVILGQLSQEAETLPGSDTERIVNTFNFNTIKENVSILSSKCIVEYNQCFYWVGNDQFYVYNAGVSALPNSMNSDWFFNNINPLYKSKVWGIAIARYQEIWWFYPRGSNTECSDVIIFNVGQNIWYDTPCARTAGDIPLLENIPLLADSQVTEFQDRSTYGLWNHEVGTDQVFLDNRQNLPIYSYFTTHVFNLASSSAGQPDSDFSMLVRRIEPDFNAPLTSSSNADFVNPMQLTLLVKSFANSPTSQFPVDNNGNISPIQLTTKTPYIDTLIQGGLVQFKFESNVLGGQYQMGKVLLTYSPGDMRRA